MAFAVVGRDDQGDVGLARLDGVQGIGVGGLLACEDEVAGGLDAVNKLLRTHGTVVVDNADADVLHLLIHHPWDDAHHHDGKQEDEARQERVAPYLQELFLEEIFQHVVIYIYH